MDENYTPIAINMIKGCEDLFPKKAHIDDAAFDLMSKEDIVVTPGKSHLIGTGVMIELPIHFEAQIRPRSGMALKHTITLTNTPGTIDAGYRGEIGVIMLNAGKEDYIVKRGDRIAQMVINRLPAVELYNSKELSKTKRGKGGFGSSGK